MTLRCCSVTNGSMIGAPLDQATSTIEPCSPKPRGGTSVASSLRRPDQTSGSKLRRWSDQQRGAAKINGLTSTLPCVWVQAPEDVAAEWTSRLYENHDAIAHLDIWSGSALYRVFLLASSLQIDLSFWPADAFAESAGHSSCFSVRPTSRLRHLRVPRTP